jgi:sugar/nucleoside kinase (ribokinase family)
LITEFQKHCDVILGLNEKEAYEIGEVLGLNIAAHTPERLSQLALEIQGRVPVSTLIVHPVKYALAVSGGKVSSVNGPFIAKPKITTGAGDHFNAGFCLGKLLGLDNESSVLTGVSTSGYYVRTATSPNIAQLTSLLRKWPGK